ncbi:PEP-utilizing enzyme, partial [Rhodococcus sp. C26F]
MTKHWFADTEVNRTFPVFSRANAGEVMPAPVSPATVGLGVGSHDSDIGVRDAYVEMGAFRHEEFDADRNTFYNIFGGHLYLSISMARVLAVRMPGDLTPEEMDRHYFGELPDILPYSEEKRPSDDDPERAAAYAEWIGSITKRRTLPEPTEDRDEVDRLVARRPDLARATDQELVDYARSFGPLSRRLMCRHIVVSNGMGVASGALGAMLAELGRSDQLTTLCAGVGEVDSAQLNWRLWELSRLDADSAEYRRGLADFIKNYGCRGPNEWELRSDTWGTRPEMVTVLIDAMRGAPDSESPQSRTDRRIAERIALTTEILDGLDEANQEAFSDVLRAVHLYSAGRERTKTNCIKIVHEMRLALRELGERAAKTGDIVDPIHVFMLTEREFDPFVRAPREFGDTLAERDAEYRTLFDRIPPFVTTGAPPSYETWAKRSDGPREAKAEAGTVLTGISGCPGKIVGFARIVLDPTDPPEFGASDILVAPITDPAWTPLFAAASGVIVEVGAQISHAVIVSRELGLPCVVSVTNATRIIPDGALVEVDGATGQVTVLDPAPGQNGAVAEA